MSHAVDPEPIDAPPAPAGAARRDWVVPAIIGSALLMLTLESTIMANALPAIARAFGEDPLRLNLAMTMFLLASAVCLPVTGWLADKFGARKILVGAMILFAVSSAACGLAHSLLELVIGRVLQGASAAMLMPVGRLVLLRTTPREQLVGALAILTMPPMVGPLIGPLLGGFIVTYFDWRWIFFINLPVALVTVILVRMFVPDVKEDGVPPMDWPGVLLTALGLAALVFGFESVGRGDLTVWETVGIFAVAVAALAAYARHAKRTPNAVIDLSMLRVRTFAASNIGGGFLRIGVGASPFLMAMLLQVGFGMSAFVAGSMTFLSGVGALFMKGCAPPILRRFGFRPVLIVNGLIVAVSYIAYAFLTPTTPVWILLLVFGVSGFFRSLQFTSLSALAFADIRPESMSRASTATSMAQQLVQSVGIGLSALVVQFIQSLRHDPTLTWRAVGPAFVAVGLISMVSLLWFVRLPAEAGEGLHNRRGRR